MRRTLVILMATAAFIGFVSWGAGVSADDTYPDTTTTTTEKEHEESTTTTVVPNTQGVTTTAKPTTTLKEDDETTTTHKPRVTTTTAPDEETTTTKKPKPTTTTTQKPTTTTTQKPTTTTSSTTSSTTSTSTSTTSTTTTEPPVINPILEVEPFAFCGPDNLPLIEITFGTRPDLDGQTGVLSFSTGGSVFLVFQSNTTTTIAYPNTTQNVNLIYSLGPETETGSVIYPENCPPETTTTTTLVASTTTLPPTSTTGPTTTTSTTIPGSTTTTTSIPGSTTTTTLPAGQPFTFGAASTVCVAEVPTIRISFVSPAQFPTLVGQTGTLTMTSVSGGFTSTQPLVYQPGTTIDILYPGTRVNADGSIADVPGWILQPNGLWVLDPSDAFLRDGIVLTYTVNPTATATVTYPPESATCANPENPTIGRIPPPVPPGATPGGTPPAGALPSTGQDVSDLALIAVLTFLTGMGFYGVGRRRRKA